MIAKAGTKKEVVCACLAMRAFRMREKKRQEEGEKRTPARGALVELLEEVVVFDEELGERFLVQQQVRVRAAQRLCVRA